MRALGWTLLVLLIVHLLAAIGFVGWLGASGRLSGQRIERVVDMFRLTVDEQAARQAQAEQIAAEAEELARNAARLEAVAQGPRTVQDRLTREAQADALAIHRLERLQQETEDLRGQIERAKQILAERKAELDQERADFDAFVEQTTRRMRDQDFQQAVAMFEQLKSEQAKQMFQTLMRQGKTNEVIDYLAVMQLRKAAGVLKEFKTPEEIEQATMLIQRLSDRGVHPVGGPIAEAANP